MLALADERSGWLRGAVPVSFVVHGLLLTLLLLLLPAIDVPDVPPEESVSVQIVPLAQEPLPETSPKPIAPPVQAELPPPAPLPQPSTVDAPNPTVPVPQPVPDVPAPEVFTTARHLYSDRILSDPRSKAAREALKQFSGDERDLQLCDLEALEQISRNRSGSAPDFVAPYAMAAEVIRPGSVEIKGGAFRAKRKWYGLKYKCGLDAHANKVTSFSFVIGSAIPESEWQAHNLVADDGPAE